MSQFECVVALGQAKSPPGIHCTGGQKGPVTGLDVVKKRKILPLSGFEHLFYLP
jgi:hypothetical protein